MDSRDLWCVPLSLEVRVPDQLCHQKSPLWSRNFMLEKLGGTSTTLCPQSDMVATFMDNEWKLSQTLNEAKPQTSAIRLEELHLSGSSHSISAHKNRNTSCAMSGACAEREAFLSCFSASLWIPGVKLRIIAFTSHHLISGLHEASIQSASRAASRCWGALRFPRRINTVRVLIWINDQTVSWSESKSRFPSWLIAFQSLMPSGL